MNSFSSLGLIEPIERALADANYETPTPIQARAIPPLLEGRDVLGCAQTGTGKTAAFLLPILHRFGTDARRVRQRPIRALVLTPTRELAAQIGDSCATYGTHMDLRHHVIFGGVNQKPQVAALRRGIDVLIATPGRLLDLQGQGFVDLSGVEFFVLDEADRMLDMGFVHDVRRVLKLLPAKRQNLLFSATMPDAIVDLASAFLHDPIRVEVDPQSTTVERIAQRVMFVAKNDKKRLLQLLLDDPDVESAIVFTRTKHGANRVVRDLERVGVEAAAIHGNKSQNARTRALDGFRSGDLRVLVATDIASRGIDVDGVSHVFNYDLPNIPESYVHRIGRTARAGREGVAVAFCDESETDYLRDIQRITGAEIDYVTDHEWHLDAAMPKAAAERNPGRRPESSGRSGPDNSGNRNGPRRRRGSGGGGRSAAEGGPRRSQNSRGGGPRSDGAPRPGSESGEGRRRRRRGGGGSGGGSGGQSGR